MIRNKASKPTLATIIQHILEVLTMAIREEKVIIEIQFGKEVKLSLFANGSILYVENCNDIIRKLLKLNLVKSQDTKSVHRNCLHSYTLLNEKSERKIKELVLFTITTKRILKT